MNRHFAAFDASYQTHCALHPITFFDVLMETMNRLRECDPRIKAIYQEVSEVGTGHRRYNQNKDINLAVLVYLRVIDEKTYSKIKNGNSRPSHSTIAAYCFVFGLDGETMERWFRFAGDNPPCVHLRELYKFFLILPPGEERALTFCNQMLEHYGYGKKHWLGV